MPTTAMCESVGAPGNNASVALRWNPPKTSADKPMAASDVTAMVSTTSDTRRRTRTRRFTGATLGFASIATGPRALDRSEHGRDRRVDSMQRGRDGAPGTGPPAQSTPAQEPFAGLRSGHDSQLLAWHEIPDALGTATRAVGPDDASQPTRPHGHLHCQAEHGADVDVAAAGRECADVVARARAAPADQPVTGRRDGFEAKRRTAVVAARADVGTDEAGRRDRDASPNRTGHRQRHVARRSLEVHEPLRVAHVPPRPSMVVVVVMSDVEDRVGEIRRGVCRAG